MLLIHYRASVKSSIQDLRASEIALDDTFAQVALLFGRRSVWPMTRYLRIF